MSSIYDSPVRHKRTPLAFTRAIFRPENYISILRTFQLCNKPFDLLSKYIFSSGDYPSIVEVRTPQDTVRINVYSPDDVQTIHEIFLKGDYNFKDIPGVVVDFGSNIGISVLYFLTSNQNCFVYGYEPLPRNVERFKQNLSAFAGRFTLTPAAVGERDETVRFGWEPTGRYGGVGRHTGQSIDVPCLDSNAQLRMILDRHPQIDLLKIDIESLEPLVTGRIPADLARKIKNIVVEYPFLSNPLAATHSMKRNNNITRFYRID